MGVIREPLAVALGVLAFACATGAAWQSGLAWPAAAARPLARVAAGAGVALSALGFSLGYWEVLSGIGDLFYRFGTPITRVLFDLAAIGLPFAIAGLVLGVLSTLHAADVPPSAIVPAILAGSAIGWLVDPYRSLAAPRMTPVRVRYESAASARPARDGGDDVDEGDERSPWNLFDSRDSGHHGGGGGSGGGGGGGGGDGDGAGAVLLVIALAVLAVAGGVVTAALVFQAGRRKAKAHLASANA